jgi:hypothetical protein
VKIEIDLTETELRQLAALHETTQWGDSCEEVAVRLIKQRLWQICGDTLNPRPSIGSEVAARAENQITRPA